jgi:hypothetical protein
VAQARDGDGLHGGSVGLVTAIDAGEPTDTERVMDRADIFRAAYTLVMSLTWDRSPDVMDVARVAEFLEEE